jgi:hypothetical protein
MSVSLNSQKEKKKQKQKKNPKHALTFFFFCFISDLTNEIIIFLVMEYHLNKNDGKLHHCV